MGSALKHRPHRNWTWITETLRNQPCRCGSFLGRCYSRHRGIAVKRCVMIRARSCARSAALAIGLAAMGGALHAEIIANGDQVSVRESTVERPGRGLSMKAVEAK